MRASKGLDSTQAPPTPKVPGSRRRKPSIRLRPESVKLLKDLAQWNNAELARQMEVDQSGIMRLLAGERQVGIPSLVGLVIAARRRFGNHVSVDYLFEFLDSEGNVVPFDAPEPVFLPRSAE